MNNEQIVKKMEDYLHISARVLADWLGKLLPEASENWWDDCVLAKLSSTQEKLIVEHGYTSLTQLELGTLLRIADKSWYELQSIECLSASVRECICDMMHTRNHWACVDGILPGKDVLLADLAVLRQFFEQMECEETILYEIDQILEEIRSLSVLVSLNTEVMSETTDSAVFGAADDTKITEKSRIYLTADPAVQGIVMSVTDLGEVRKFTVFVNGSLKPFYSGQIALYEEKPFGNWVDSNTFRSYLTAFLINNPSGNNLYSLHAARIDFVPYQFKPALKLIHADEPRILIADSVGVGKTIEAGLIIKELQARKELDNILIICPKPLVTERKWELEMKRFDEDFQPVNGPMLRQIISDAHKSGVWQDGYSRMIVPYSILDSRAYQGKAGKGRIFGLKDLDPAPHFDLVIIDEAHHIRNGSEEKEKAFEYKCVKFFCDHADAVVMLTATPLQTRDDDLFTLLHILRPDVVIDKQTFDMMSRPNVHISDAVKAIRRAGEQWQEQAVEALRHVPETQWGEKVTASDPVYGEIIETLQQDTISREERVKLISDAENLHSFHSMLNRTRRKDIQDFCIRRPYTLASDFTGQQKELHDELLRFEANALLQLHSNARSIPFMMSTIRRQAASCIFGLAPHIRELIERRFQGLEYDPDIDAPECRLQDSDIRALTDSAQKLLELADALPEEDPKYDQMMEVVMGKQKQTNNKIILFSTYRHTLQYLKEKLRDAGLRVAQVDGGTKDAMRQAFRMRFELPKEDEDALDILLFTEVGSEGLDYQFCDMMINYDLPWNPMRIEQRIGRIDRRGQMSETVSIYNMITNDTVDADIYYRCLWRIGIFESSIGECDEILGDIAAGLNDIVMNAALTDEERRIKLEQMADNEVRRLQEMNHLEEEEKEFFGFDLSGYMISQDIYNAENPWLSQKSLQILIEQYLLCRLGEGTYILGEGALKQLRLSNDAKAELRSDFQKISGKKTAVQQSWDAYLKQNGKTYHPVTFDATTAGRERSAFFITPVHPLTKQAAAYFAANEQAYIRLRYGSEVIPAGTHHFSVYAWSYLGMQPRFRLVIVCEDDTVAEELPDILHEAQCEAAPISIQASNWEMLEGKHVKLWMAEKTHELQEAQNLSRFRTESLSSNFRNRKRSLEQKILNASDERIRRMYTTMLENAEKDYPLKISEIQKQADHTDIHTMLIANGILEVVN